uniref:BACK domain-containing protein n=1 Tax=Glossina austeni TaxID=7395 RepID=A0A1A9UDK3_GLOAU
MASKTKIEVSAKFDTAEAVHLSLVYLSNSIAAKIVNQVERISPKKCKNSDYGNTYLYGLTKMRTNQKITELIKEVQDLVKPEDIAYKAAITWIIRNLARRVHLAELMSQIRLPLVSTEFLTDDR